MWTQARAKERLKSTPSLTRGGSLELVDDSDLRRKDGLTVHDRAAAPKVRVVAVAIDVTLGLPHRTSR